MRISDWSSDVCSSDLLFLDLVDGGFESFRLDLHMLRIGAVRQSCQRFIVFRRRALRDVGKEKVGGINRRKLLAPCLAFFRRSGDWPAALHWPPHTERGPAAQSVFPPETAHNSPSPWVYFHINIC